MSEMSFRPAALVPTPEECQATLRSHHALPETYACVYLTGSLIRGWGNSGSDLDFYVITDEPWHPSEAVSASVPLGQGKIYFKALKESGVGWDVEYWQEAQIEQVLAKVSREHYEQRVLLGGLLTGFERDMLERLLYAVPIDGASWLAETRRRLEASAFLPMVVCDALALAKTYLDDAEGMLAIGDDDSAVLAARTAFTHTVDGLLAAHGVAARNAKWHARRFREAAPSVMGYEEYWAIETMRGYSRDEGAGWVRQVIDSCRRIANELTDASE
jgi:hypothetical protein